MIKFNDIQGVLKDYPPPEKKKAECLIGVFQGQGVGPEVIKAALVVLEAAADGTHHSFEIKTLDTTTPSSKTVPLSSVITFCESIFDRGGVVMAGPIGGRGVYDLRSHFDLFCKITPLCPSLSLSDAGVIKSEILDGVDILVIRENCSGIYMGQWDEKELDNDLAGTHTFQYSRQETLRILRVAFDLASKRRKRLTLVLKPGGLPTISRIWTEALDEIASERDDVAVEILEVDNAAFQLIRFPKRFDVVVTGNLFGDILSDCGGLLLGSRGMCYSGNFGPCGKAIYQTGHGAAYDIAGSNQANPVAQIHSLSMMLRTSFGLKALPEIIENGVENALNEGWRTPDIAVTGSKVVGTEELGHKIAQAIIKLKAI